MIRPAQKPLKPELMAPAGDEDSLRAAIRAGADAVYFGLPDWNARARATNFPLESIAERIAEIHRDGVRAYVTFNTLIFGAEEKAAHEALELLAEARPDALIVQDLGVARYVHERFPSLRLHASTQMTISSARGVDFVRRFAIDRVILARELTLPEIDRLRAETAGRMELEVFVHGALCVSYSGQCFSSEAWGGRSANRGQCAQACRLPYDLIVDGTIRDLGDRAYLLSPHDLEGVRRIPALIESGVDAFKIEGRMKSAAYVAAATTLYRDAIDRVVLRAGTGSGAGTGTSMDDRHEERADLARAARAVFSRGASEGFLGGIDHQRLVDGRVRSHRGVRIGSVCAVFPAGSIEVEIEIDPGAAPPTAGDGILFANGPNESDETGGRIHAVDPLSGDASRVRLRLRFGREARLDARRMPSGCPVFLTHDHVLDLSLRRMIQDPAQRKRIPLTVEASGTLGSPLRAVFRDPDGGEARVESASPLVAAQEHGLDAATVRAHLGKLGDTRYALGEMRATIDGALAIPVREMNAMRRDAVSILERLRGGPIAGISDGEGEGEGANAGDRAAVAKRAGDASVLGEESSPVIDAIARADRIAVDTDRAAGIADAAGPARVDGLTSGAPASDPFIVLCRTREQVEAALDAGATRLALDFLDLVGLKAAAAIARAARAELTLATPRIQKPGEEKILDFMLRCAPDAILVRNLASLEQLTRTPGCPTRIGDTPLNAVNAAAISVLVEAGCARVSPGLDLNGDQLLSLLRASDGPRAEAIEIPLQHHLPLFHTEHCVFAAFMSNGADWRTCGRPCDRHRIRLRDRTGHEHAVIADVGCRNTVFGARAQSVLFILADLREAGVRHFRLELLEQDGRATRDLIRIYRGVWDGRTTAADGLRRLKATARFGISGGSPDLPRRLDWKPPGGKRSQPAHPTRPTGGRRPR